MNDRNEDCFVVIRSAHERTAAACRDIVARQVNSENIHVVQEIPFSAAVRKTFDLGIEANKKWTLAIDADILLKNDAISALVQLGERLPAYFFRIEGRVLDKFFGFPRKGGPHLYRTSLLGTAYLHLDAVRDTIRPESKVVRTMVEKGFHSYQGEEVFGIHDFFQFHRDIFRKTFVYAGKFPRFISYFEEYWSASANQWNDSDYLVARLGLMEGKATAVDSLPNVDFLNDIYDKICIEHQLLEKEVLSDAVDPDKLIGDFDCPREARDFERDAAIVHRTDQPVKRNIGKKLIKSFSRLLTRIKNL